MPVMALQLSIVAKSALIMIICILNKTISTLGKLNNILITLLSTLLTLLSTLSTSNEYTFYSNEVHFLRQWSTLFAAFLVHILLQ